MRRVLPLVAVDVVLVVLAIFGIVLVTSPDHPSSVQGALAWTLFAVLVLLVWTLVVLLWRAVRRG